MDVSKSASLRARVCHLHDHRQTNKQTCGQQWTLIKYSLNEIEKWQEKESLVTKKYAIIIIAVYAPDVWSKNTENHNDI